MRRLTILIAASMLLAQAVDAAAEHPLRAAIAAAVSERIGAVRAVEIEIVSGAHARPEGLLQGFGELAEAQRAKATGRASVAGGLSAAPAPGARTGRPTRFLVTPSSGRPFSVVARVDVVAAHAVAIRAVDRGVELTAADVEWTEGPVDEQLFQPLPTLEDIIGARARRSIAPGEVVISTALAKPIAVRAGEEVALTIRSGAIEASGPARAVSSGSVGDVIRVTTPGSREIRRARIIAPASVEIVR